MEDKKKELNDYERKMLYKEALYVIKILMLRVPTDYEASVMRRLKEAGKDD